MPNKSVKVDRSQEPNLTSQEYREDERRRREFLYESQDMMAESSTEYDPTQHLEDLEEGEIPAHQSKMSLKRTLVKSMMSYGPASMYLPL